VREFSTAMATYIANTLNIEPITIIGVDWAGDGSEVLYADRDIENIEGKILGVGNLDNVLSTKAGQSASINVRLDDTDSTIKTYLDTYDVYGVACTVYQMFNDSTLTLDDKFTLFRGQVTFDVTWDEGERYVELTILTEIEDREVGFSPEEGQFDFVSPEAVGKAWPLCFGAPLHVPATRVKQVIRASLNDRFCIVDPILYYKRFVLFEAIYANYSLYLYYGNLTLNGNNLDVTANDLLWGFLDLLRRQRIWKVAVEKQHKKIRRLKKAVKNLRKGIASEVNVAFKEAQLERAEATLAKIMLGEPATVNQAFILIAGQIPAIEADIKVKNQAMAAQYMVIVQISKLYQQLLQVQLEICKQERCVDDSLQLRDAKYFPAGEEIEVFINNLRFRGTITDNTFYIDAILPKYHNVILAERQEITTECYEEVEQYATFWAPNTSIQLKGMYALVYNNTTEHNHIIKITEQVGTKCTMELVNHSGKTQSDEINKLIKGQTISSLVVGSTGNNPYTVILSKLPNFIGPNAFTAATMQGFADWSAQVFNTFFSATPTSTVINNYINDNIGAENISPEAWLILNRLDILDRQANALRLMFIGDLNPLWAFTVTVFDFDRLIEVSPVVMLHWLTPDILADEIPKSAPWSAEQGADVVDATEQCEIYVANILESEVKLVAAYRVNEDGVRSLTKVPSDYYTTQIEELTTTSAVPFQLTTVRVHIPLKTLNEQWEDEIYVSLIEKDLETGEPEIGNNVADIIQYLVLTYTDKAVDTESFNDVQAAIQNYPANFAILDRKNAFEQINEIAFQARCVAYIKEDVYYLRYLSAKPLTTEATIGVSEVQQGTMSVGYSDLTDMMTRLTAIWKPDYLPDTEENRLTLRHNIGKYGLHENEIDFYIYNIEELVLKSATYWLIQRCNSWKYVSLTVPTSQLTIELFDVVTIALPGLVTATSIVGIVEEFNYDSDNNNVQVTVRLAVRSGEMSEYKFAWSATAGVDDEFPEDLDIQSGYVGSGNPIISGSLEDC